MCLSTLIDDVFRRNEPMFWALTDEITVKNEDHWPKNANLLKKVQRFDLTGEFKSPALIDRNWVLVDGYDTYKIAKMRGIEWIPVRIVKLNR